MEQCPTQTSARDNVVISFPIEFTVEGTPVSLQAKRAAARTAWQARVRQASMSALPEHHFASDASMAVTLFYFPRSPMEGDIDNIVKPILDALRQHIYPDDRQIERIWIQKFDPGHEFQFLVRSAALSKALEHHRPVLYIRVTDDVAEGLV